MASSFLNMLPRFSARIGSRWTMQAMVNRGSALSRPSQALFPVGRFVGIAGLGLGISLLSKGRTYCDPSPLREPPAAASRPASPVPEKIPPPLASSVSVYELSFGTVAGFCAGVFIKKGLKTVAFILGGVFVMLQYLGHTSILRVDWSKMATRFENAVSTTDASGHRQTPTVVTAWNWLVNFLVADFPPRATFLAGLVLGLRVG
ncbi:FUN14 family-domain-containing protein [Mycena floridula]|nr:FUN14 family-domain-containing protein [Mycena floridula]